MKITIWIAAEHSLPWWQIYEKNGLREAIVIGIDYVKIETDRHMDKVLGTPVHSPEGPVRIRNAAMWDLFSVLFCI